MSRVLKQTVRKGLRNVFGVDVVRTTATVSFDEGWAEERDYWLNVIGDFYQTEYGLKLHASQTDPSLVPPLDTVVKIQRANKADADAFFASGYRTALAYQTELRDYDYPANRMQNMLEMGVGLGRLIIHYFPLLRLRQLRVHSRSLFPNGPVGRRIAADYPTRRVPHLQCAGCEPLP